MRELNYKNSLEKLNEFLEILDIKTDVEKFCLENWGTSDINLVLSRERELRLKWDNLMNLRFLDDIKDYDTIYRYSVELDHLIELYIVAGY